MRVLPRALARRFARMQRRRAPAAGIPYGVCLVLGPREVAGG